MRILLTLLLAMSAIYSPMAGPLKCSVCQEIIKAKFVWMEGPSLDDKRPVCTACSQLETVCFVCGLPVKTSFKNFDDGRLICEHDAAIGIASQSDADSLFQEVKRDVMQILAGSGVLPDRNIKLALADKKQIDQLRKPDGAGHAKTAMVMGLTGSQLVRNDEYEHSIHILDNLPPARYAAVCAHEYGHAWINENVRSGRKLDPNSVEGFCEWVSYKVMAQRNEFVEQKMILANKYTRGQIDAFIKADESFRSYDVIKWIKDGSDNQINFGDPSLVLTLDRQPVPLPVWGAPAPSAVPSTLVLRGISGNSSRRFALINDCTLQKNETGRVRVGSTNVVVQCLSISSNSVVIRLRGAETTTQLFLSSTR